MPTSRERRATLPTALSIAGSDPSGGAGIQADLKTFSAYGVFGMTALTVATVGNTIGVFRIVPIGAPDVAAQIDAVCEDIPVVAAKTGMLASAEVIEAVALAVRRHQIAPLVVDPVMTTRRGDRLLDEGAERRLVEFLLPLAAVVTPNRPEAERLSGIAIRTRADMLRAAEAILVLGARGVIVKGGHLEDDPNASDLLYDGAQTVWLESPRVATVHTHGAGCTFAAAIAAGLARGWDVPAAAMEAKRYVAGAIAHAPGLGHGRGPLHHLWGGPMGRDCASLAPAEAAP